MWSLVMLADFSAKVHSEFHGHELREYLLAAHWVGASRGPQYPFPIWDSGSGIAPVIEK
jgi:hypothetical protein